MLTALGLNSLWINCVVLLRELTFVSVINYIILSHRKGAFFFYSNVTVTVT